MIELDRIISDLETIKRRPDMYVNPVSPEMLFGYLTGFQRGILVSQNLFTFHQFVEAHKLAMKSRGLIRTAKAPYRELREKGLTEDDIVQEMIDVEIEMWRILARLV